MVIADPLCQDTETSKGGLIGPVDSNTFKDAVATTPSPCLGLYVLGAQICLSELGVSFARIPLKGDSPKTDWFLNIYCHVVLWLERVSPYLCGFY